MPFWVAMPTGPTAPVKSWIDVTLIVAGRPELPLPPPLLDVLQPATARERAAVVPTAARTRRRDRRDRIAAVDWLIFVPPRVDSAKSGCRGWGSYGVWS
jgi:hypothetical protein